MSFTYMKMRTSYKYSIARLKILLAFSLSLNFSKDLVIIIDAMGFLRYQIISQKFGIFDSFVTSLRGVSWLSESRTERRTRVQVPSKPIFFGILLDFLQGFLFLID